MKLFTNVVVWILLIANSYTQYIQVGNKLVGTGLVAFPTHGSSVSISADGNTAIVGSSMEFFGAGSATIYVREGIEWRQQGPKLVGAGFSALARQGCSVAISADGNTAVIGAYGDNGLIGAACIFVRVGGVWTQQGPKLLGSDSFGLSWQGYSVAISSDGNTVIVGGSNDNTGIGAAWVYTRLGGVWTQQGPKLVGNGYVGQPYQGYSVAISSSGNSAIIGGSFDNGNIGAVWFFARSGGVWTQQGAKLKGNDYIGAAGQGTSVAISADGNTAVSGGNFDNNGIGASWIFIRNGGAWTQQGPKLVGTGYNNLPEQGYSVAISSDGNNVVVGGHSDNGNIGAAWVFNRTGGTWTQKDSKIVGSDYIGSPMQGGSVSISGCGNSIIVGGGSDNGGKGAAWIFHEYAPDGSGTLTVTPQNSNCNQSGLTFNFTYTVADGGLSNGEINILLPNDWYAGNAVSSTGSASIYGSVIKVTGVTLDGGSTLTINLEGVNTGSSSGANIFVSSVKTTPGGTLIPVSVSPSVYLTGSQNTNANLIITFPQGGEKWFSGLCKYITWKISGGVICGTLQLEYSTNNGISWTKINTTPIAGVLRYPWLLPAVNSTQCKIRISNYITHRVYDITDNPFTINIPSSAIQCYPNPFNPSTTITFLLHRNSIVTLKIYDMTGREVKTLINNNLTAGMHLIQWNADDNNGNKVSSGIYLFRLATDEEVISKKLTLLK